MAMKVPHIRDMFPAGDPGLKRKFRMVLDPRELGIKAGCILIVVALLWFIAGLIWH
jgi:hypothetical protein